LVRAKILQPRFGWAVFVFVFNQVYLFDVAEVNGFLLKANPDFDKDFFIINDNLKAIRCQKNDAENDQKDNVTTYIHPVGTPIVDITNGYRC